MGRELTVALVGATGVVGAEFLRCMEERDFPVKELRLLATKRSEGRELTFRSKTHVVHETTHDAFDGADVAFISASTAASKELCPVAAGKGAVAFDDSSAFRQQEGVPLVVPEVNPEDLRQHNGIIATPNCTTVPLVLSLHPLIQDRAVTRIIADTYQATSGSGGAAVTELREQNAVIVGGGEIGADRFNEYPKQIANNALPQVDVFLDDGYTKEEWKMLVESRKILHQPELPLSATCVRIPTERAHAIAVHADFDRPISPEEAHERWAAQPGLSVIDGRAAGEWPTPLDADGIDDTLVGRARVDVTNPNGLAWWVVADNLRKGAALNIVQMVEWMLDDGCL
ncbi:MAG: aspartate-semialdehyde dehydrogenase [Chloroflexi bacterium]|nr:aspartate-semialdehyde dehydrogenase [Chloroflexota bacterium]MCY3685117.1 aspartate-semialdehyde dehydrogenase [Chloroflexota bacterium]